MKANAAAQKAELDRLYSEMISTANQGYDKSANNAYINYRQGQKALPEQLSQYGITGGASESLTLSFRQHTVVILLKMSMSGIIACLTSDRARFSSTPT